MEKLTLQSSKSKSRSVIWTEARDNLGPLRVLGTGNDSQLTHIAVDDVDLDLKSLNKNSFGFESVRIKSSYVT